MKPPIVFFDLGNTLLEGTENSARRLLASRLFLSEKETKRVGRLIMTHPSTHPSTLVDVMKMLLPDRKVLEIESILEEVWEEQALSVKLKDGAAPVLRTLKALGCTLGIISNTWCPVYEGLRARCPIVTDLMDHVYLSFQRGCKKPSPELYSKAVQGTGEPASSCWMVGDSYELDMEPAKEVGMHTVWLLSRPEREAGLLAQILRGEKWTPDWTAENLEDVLTYFLNQGV